MFLTRVLTLEALFKFKYYLSMKALKDEVLFITLLQKFLVICGKECK